MLTFKFTLLSPASHRHPASEAANTCHWLWRAADGKEKCTSVMSRLVADSRKPVYTACCKETSCLPWKTGKWGSSSGVSAPFPSLGFLSKPQPTHPLKMLWNVSYLPFGAPLDGHLTTHFHNTFAHSLFLPSNYSPFFHNSWHSAPLSVFIGVLISPTLRSTLRAETDLSILMHFTVPP